jgi:dihydroorotase
MADRHLKDGEMTKESVEYKEAASTGATVMPPL